MKKNLLLLIPVLIIAIFFACGGENDKELSNVDKDKIESDTIDDTKEKMGVAQNVYYTIPSTSEMAALLQEDGAVCNIKLLNDLNLVDKYATSREQAIALGIYGADLNYCSIFERTNDAMFYMECTNNLAAKLQIENAISEETITRAEENIDNRDSMLQIISDMFYELQEYLAENDKDEISALIIGAGWVEGLYLATQTVNEKNPNKKILNRIAEQKMSLENLILFLTDYSKNDDVKGMLADVKKIEAVYTKITVEKESTEVTTEKDGTMVIGGKTNVSITMDQFLELKKVVKEIRDSYVKIK